MKVLTQHLDTGRTALLDAPDPAPQPHEVVVETICSAISIGTERMLAGFARANLLDKALQQPERVRQVIARARRDGLAQTAQTIQRRLAQPLTLGYSQVGVVVSCGAHVEGVTPGQRVASNGPHASRAAVPATLCALVPDGVPAWQAAHTTICAVALHALRLARPELGESVVVVGAGLLGFVAAQLARAHGCDVMVVEPDPQRRAMARAIGALTTSPDCAADAVAAWAGEGADCVLVCASSDDAGLLQRASRLCRRRGRLVLVGAAPIALDRADLYQRELTFQVSAAYGPGRYAPGYEEEGLDYPQAHVRWTAQRNFDAVLAMMRRGALDLTALDPVQLAPDAAPALYDQLAQRPPTAAIIRWRPDPEPAERPRNETRHEPRAATPSVPQRGAPITALGVIGAGNFASQTFLPALRSLGVTPAAICAGSGVAAGQAAAMFKIPRAVADAAQLIAAPELDAVAILTRHDSHAALTIAALQAGKHVFVEKPLCVTAAELDAIIAAFDARPDPAQRLVVGANRRYAPMTAHALRLLEDLPGPRRIRAIIHAGPLPDDHWTRRAPQGGRLLGEAIHWLDWCRAIAGQPILGTPHVERRSGWSEVHVLFHEGHTATIEYIEASPPGTPKERLEIEAAGRMIEIEDWRALRAYGWSGMSMAHVIARRGHEELIGAFVRGEGCVAADELFEVARAALAMAGGG